MLHDSLAAATTGCLTLHCVMPLASAVIYVHQWRSSKVTTRPRTWSLLAGSQLPDGTTAGDRAS